jgi:hypothetical protein
VCSLICVLEWSPDAWIYFWTLSGELLVLLRRDQLIFRRVSVFNIIAVVCNKNKHCTTKVFVLVYLMALIVVRTRMFRYSGVTWCHFILSPQIMLVYVTTSFVIALVWLHRRVVGRRLAVLSNN